MGLTREGGRGGEARGTPRHGGGRQAIHSLESGGDGDVTPEMSPAPLLHSPMECLTVAPRARTNAYVVPMLDRPTCRPLTRPFRFPFSVVRSWLSTLRKKLARVEVKSHRGNSLVRYLAPRPLSINFPPSLRPSRPLCLSPSPSLPKLESGDLGAATPSLADRRRDLPRLSAPPLTTPFRHLNVKCS